MLPLEDGFSRRFYYLRLSVTDVCNFRCTYCLPDGYRPPEGH
ncbi:MAG: GTP 3',8-cyclase MoaA, partial [Aeromonas veronii]